MSESVCVYCLNIVNDYVCPHCNEYDGLMPLDQAKSYLGEDFPEEFEELTERLESQGFTVVMVETSSQLD